MLSEGPCSLARLGNLLAITREAVRIIEGKALEKIRTDAHCLLKEFAEW